MERADFFSNYADKSKYNIYFQKFHYIIVYKLQKINNYSN